MYLFILFYFIYLFTDFLFYFFYGLILLLNRGVLGLDFSFLDVVQESGSVSGCFLFVPITSWNSSSFIYSTLSITSISLLSSFSDPVVAAVICPSATAGFAFGFGFFIFRFLFCHLWCWLWLLWLLLLPWGSFLLVSFLGLIVGILCFVFFCLHQFL